MMVELILKEKLGLPRVSFHQHMPYAYAHVLQTQDNGIPWTAAGNCGMRTPCIVPMDNQDQVLYTRARASINKHDARVRTRIP